jgi:hypothetical protein
MNKRALQYWKNINEKSDSTLQDTIAVRERENHRKEKQEQLRFLIPVIISVIALLVALIK